MRLDEPRVVPLAEGEWDAEIDGLLRAGNREPLNIFKTLAHHPHLMRRWLVFGAHVLSKSTLPARDRELVILRVGWLCQAEYEFGQHTVIGRASGLNDAEIRRITEGPDAPGWSDFDATLLRATDELVGDAFVTDATWQALSARYDTQQKIDLIFCIGQYNLVSMALNSLGVQLDEGVPGFPDPEPEPGRGPIRS
jgi:alkylhydroperoxidase family enzyme